MLRVLVVLPLYGGSLPVGRYAAEGLRECGCLVETFGSPDFYPAYAGLKNLRIGADRLDGLQNSFLQMLGQALQAKVEAFSPDLVLCMAQAPVSRSVLGRLRKDGVRTAMWFVEDFRLFTYWRAFAPYYDLFAVIQKEPFLGELAGMGVANAFYLPLAALPSAHRPLELTPAEREEFGSDISFMGAGYPNRQRAFLSLRHLNFKIWGTEWDTDPRLAPLLAPLVQRGGARISPEDSVRIYNAAGINLNLHSSINPESLVSGGDFVNPRTFELAACGAFQLVDDRSLLPELFDGGDLACFGTFEEMLEKIAWYSDRPEERRSMAERARARVLAAHTYARRMRTLLDEASARLEGFGRPRAVAWPTDLPADVAATLTSLLTELHLPATASFDEVITAVRGRNTPLESLESALLFLDEWKKLYLK